MGVALAIEWAGGPIGANGSGQLNPRGKEVRIDLQPGQGAACSVECHGPLGPSGGNEGRAGGMGKGALAMEPSAVATTVLLLRTTR